MTAVIMVVDDDCNVLRLLDIVLRPLPYAIVTFDEPKGAIELLASVTPDLFILDYMMPRMSGVELCRYIRSHRPTARVPIIMLSALYDPVAIRKGSEAGANVFLSKTALHSHLIKNVRGLLDTENALC